MKNLKHNIISWITIALSFFFTLGILYVAYGALANLPAKVWTGSWLLSTDWNNMVDSLTELDGKSVPSWAIQAFYLANCPNLWIPADWTNWTPDLRGVFIRWTWNPVWYTDNNWAHTLWTKQDDATKLLMNWASTWNAPEWNSSFWVITHKPSIEMIWTEAWFRWSYVWRATLRGAMDTNWWWSSETRPKNVALLYCMKQ